MRHQSQPVLSDSGTISVKSLKRDVIFEGRDKAYYPSDKPDLIIQEFKTVAVEDGKKRLKKSDVAALKNSISAYLFEYIEGFHIPTHFVRKISETETMVRQLEMIPIVVSVYNYAIDELPKRLGVQDGAALEFPIFEHYYKKPDLGSPWINEYHVFAMGLMTPDEFKQINRVTSKVNAVLRSLCDRRKLLLANLKLEFGRFKGQVYLGDELSPATCTFWNAECPKERTKYSLTDERAEEHCAELFDRLSLKA